MKTHVRLPQVEPSPRLGYLWLALGTLCSLFAANGRWDIPLAAWLGPFFLLRFTRTRKPLSGFALVWLASAIAMLFTVYSLQLLTPIITYPGERSAGEPALPAESRGRGIPHFLHARLWKRLLTGLHAVWQPPAFADHFGHRHLWREFPHCLVCLRWELDLGAGLCLAQDTRRHAPLQWTAGTGPAGWESTTRPVPTIRPDGSRRRDQRICFNAPKGAGGDRSLFHDAALHPYRPGAVARGFCPPRR